jgi:hypothetical protein
MNREEFLEAYLPKQMPVSVAFAAMSHFLALHFNQVGGSSDVVAFIRSIPADGLGQPLSDEVYDRFKDAVIDADRLEMVDPLRGPN